MTIVCNAADEFQCFATIVDNGTIMVPDMFTTPVFCNGVELTKRIKRSKRHHYQLFEYTPSEEDVVYPLYPDPIHVMEQDALIVAPHMSLTVGLANWIYHENGSYRIQTNFNGTLLYIP
jgi:hypothetical protein